MASISAEQTPVARTMAVDQFREGHIHLLVCTDLMARGIDFLNVQTVVNYDFPQSAVDYIHRLTPRMPPYDAATSRVSRGPLSVSCWLHGAVHTGKYIHTFMQVNHA